MTVRYGFYGEEWEEENVSELDAHLNTDSTEGHSDEDSVHSSYDEQEHILHDIPQLESESFICENLNQGLEDPRLCKEVLCMIQLYSLIYLPL